MMAGYTLFSFLLLHAEEDNIAQFIFWLVI